MTEMIRLEEVMGVKKALEDGQFVISDRYVYDKYIMEKLPQLKQNNYPKSLYDNKAPGENKLDHILPCAYLWGNTFSGVCWLEFLHDDNWFVQSSHLKIKKFLKMESCEEF